MQTYIYIYVYVYLCICVYIYIYISGLTTRPSVSPWLGVCVHACVCVRACACVARASKWLCFEQHLHTYAMCVGPVDSDIDLDIYYLLYCAVPCLLAASRFARAGTALQGPQSCGCGIRRALCSRPGEPKSKAGKCALCIKRTGTSAYLPYRPVHMHAGPLLVVQLVLAGRARSESPIQRVLTLYAAI
jgi:hypothetical protein